MVSMEPQVWDRTLGWARVGYFDLEDVALGDYSDYESTGDRESPVQEESKNKQTTGSVS